MSTSESKSAIVLELAEEFLGRYRHGERPSLKEYIDRRPDLAAEIREVFPAMAMMENIALADESLRRPADWQQKTTDDAQRTGPYEAGHEPVGEVSGQGEWPAILGYQILKLLGRGGMGVVYQARQTSLKRLVALKMIRSGEHANPELRVRFLGEAEAVARLRHPNIVQIYEVGEAAGQPFFALEYIEGGTLAQHLAGTPQPPRQTAQLVRTLAQAVEAAHTRGVIHRDLKPANILLQMRNTECGTGNEGKAASLDSAFPKITDFGLAKQLGDDSGQTQSGTILGTPSYMAPEQAEGRIHAINPATDVYALVAILYECLTGRPPFKGATKFETLEQVRQRDPVPPSQLRPKLPRDLETICLKCLSKDPTKRYGAAEQLADELGRFLDGRPILARPVGLLERSYRWCRRNPVAAGFLLTLLLATVATTGLTVWALGERDRADNKAKEAATNAANEFAARQRADREAEAAWASQYIAHVNRMESDWENAHIGRILDTLSIYHEPPGNRKDVRGWEWYYQKRLCHQELRTMTGHTHWVQSVAFSPDGVQLASAGYDRTVRLWDGAKGQVIKTLNEQKSEVQSVVFSPDGCRLASAGGDGVKLWDTITGQELRSFTGHTGKVAQVVFSPDGSRLASAGTDRTVRLWDVASGREFCSLRGHANTVFSVAYSPDGSRLASASWDGKVRLWDAASGQEQRTLRGHTGPVRSVTFSPDGMRLASAGNDWTVRLWDTTSGRLFLTLKGHTSEVWCVAYSPDGSRLASASADRTVRVWNAHYGQELLSLKGHQYAVTSVAYSPDGSRLASASQDQTVRVWGMASDQEFRTLPGHTKQVQSLEFSPDGRRLASVGHDRTIRLWDVASGQEYSSLQGDTNTGLSVSYSPDGSRLASIGEDSVNLWDTITGQEVRSFKGHTGIVHDVAHSPDGTRLASAGADQTVRLWDAASGQELRTLRGHTGPVTSVAYSPDGTRLASASADQTVLLRDTTSGQVLSTLTGHTDAVVSVAFSPDGSRLASASGDRTVKLWDAASGQELRTFKKRPGRVHCVAFSPDGKWLADAGEDQVIRLADARPLTAEVSTEVEAFQLVEYLAEKPFPRGEIRAAVQGDKIISGRVRNKALDFAEHFKVDANPANYYTAAWRVARHPFASDLLCRSALAQMQEACVRAPDNAQYRLGLGVVQYRLGKFQKERYAEALATLNQCDPNHPLTLTFLAMGQHQLGDKEPARTTLNRLRETMKSPQWAANAEAQVGLREAVELIEGKKPGL